MLAVLLWMKKAHMRDSHLIICGRLWQNHNVRAAGTYKEINRSGFAELQMTKEI